MPQKGLHANKDTFTRRNVKTTRKEQIRNAAATKRMATDLLKLRPLADVHMAEIGAPVKTFVSDHDAAVGQIKLPPTAFLEAALSKVVHSAFSLENNIAKVLAKLKTFIGQQLHRLRNNDAFLVRVELKRVDQPS